MESVFAARSAQTLYVVLGSALGVVLATAGLFRADNFDQSIQSFLYVLLLVMFSLNCGLLWLAARHDSIIILWLSIGSFALLEFFFLTERVLVFSRDDKGWPVMEFGKDVGHFWILFLFLLVWFLAEFVMSRASRTR